MSSRRPHRTQPFAVSLALSLTALLAVPLAAQDDSQATPLPTRQAELLVPDEPPSTVPFSIFLDGSPRFALRPIAAALGVQLRTGPKGESHTLIFESQHIIVGPDKPLMVTVSPTFPGPGAITNLAQTPIMGSYGLQVPLDFLRRSFGEQLNCELTWTPEPPQLAISRRGLRELNGSINLVRQHGVTTVEMRFSEPPRYRVERFPGAVEIRLEGDRLREPFAPPQQDDALVTGIVAGPDRIRIELATNAAAATPRLVAGDSLVVEVFQQTAVAPTGEERSLRSADHSGRIRTIVLDPGHGGEETGAIGPAGTAESALTLQVARALRRQLERRLPVRVLLTRNSDVDVPHDSRTALANQNKADLFVSLHFNSSFGPVAHGAETFFLSREASDQLAAELAAAENSASGGESDAQLGLQLILWDLAQSYHLAESQRFANLVQEELNLALGLRDRGVKQAPFRVLMGASMPAVLVELGFLSNPEEETKLQDPSYVAELVDALVRAVTRFKTQMEARTEAEAETAEAGTLTP